MISQNDTAAFAASRSRRSRLRLNGAVPRAWAALRAAIAPSTISGRAASAGAMFARAMPPGGTPAGTTSGYAMLARRGLTCALAALTLTAGLIALAPSPAVAASINNKDPSDYKLQIRRPATRAKGSETIILKAGKDVQELCKEGCVLRLEVAATAAGAPPSDADMRKTRPKNAAKNRVKDPAELARQQAKDDGYLLEGNEALSIEGGLLYFDGLLTAPAK